MHMHHRMSDMQTIAPIIWCWATVRENKETVGTRICKDKAHIVKYLVFTGK